MIINIAMDFSYEHLRHSLSQGTRPVPADPELVPAAVLAPLFWQSGRLTVLFTQRTHLVKHHQGQISFPGGVRDPEDDSFLATALREASEEIGLAADDVEILGELNPSQTITGFLVRSYLGLIPFPYNFTLNTREVARLITVPVADLLIAPRWWQEMYEYGGRQEAVYFCRVGETVIWGATARILVDLLTRLDPGFAPGAAAGGQEAYL